MTKTVIALLAFAIMTGAASAQNRKEIYELQERCGKRAEQIYEKDFPEQGELHCDFIFVTEDLVPRIESIRVDRETQAADHQPVILTLR